MSALETQELAEVVQRVRGWPPPMRIALARQILETLETPALAEAPPRLPRGPLKVAPWHCAHPILMMAACPGGVVAVASTLHLPGSATFGSDAK